MKNLGKKSKILGVFIAALSFAVCGALFSCGEVDKTGIFWNIQQEIKLNEGIVHGNIMSIVEVGGTIYAGGGKIYCKPAGESWREFSSPGGNVVALGVNGGDLQAMTSSTSSEGGTTNKYFKFDTAADRWVTVPEGDFKYTSTVAEAKRRSGLSEALCYYQKGANEKLYIGKTAGASVTTVGSNATDTVVNTVPFENLPGSNVDAAIGMYHVVSIYFDDVNNIIYAGIIGRSSSQGRKNNGLWAYDPARNVWDRV